MEALERAGYRGRMSVELYRLFRPQMLAAAAKANREHPRSVDYEQREELRPWQWSR